MKITTQKKLSLFNILVLMLFTLPLAASHPPIDVQKAIAIVSDANFCQNIETIVVSMQENFESIIGEFTGNSGGPIIREDNGKVVGMLTSIVTTSGEYGLSSALPSKYIINFCKNNGILGR